MTPEEVIALAEDSEDEILLLEPRDEYDRCIVGIVERFNSVFVVYSKKCVLDYLISEITGDAAPDDDVDFPPDLQALEHYQFNIVGGWLGDGTPAFMLDNEETP